MKISSLYFFRTLGVMVSMLLVFIVVYPFVYMMLPEATARLADLPQDLLIFGLVEGVVVPLCGLWLYRRSRPAEVGRRVLEKSDTRDVL